MPRRRDPLRHPLVRATLFLALLLLTILALLAWQHRRIADSLAAWRLEDQTALIEALATEHGLAPTWIEAVIIAESSGRPQAVSRKGARGLMQITPIAEQDVLARFPRIRQGDLFDPAYNLQVGCAYLGYLHRRFEGDLPAALAAYNMGPTRLRRLMRTYPDMTTAELIQRHTPRETRAYVRRVLELAELPPLPPPAAAASTAPGHTR